MALPAILALIARSGVTQAVKKYGKQAVQAAQKAEKKTSGAVGSRRPLREAAAKQKPTDKRVRGVRAKSKSATTRRANANRRSNAEATAAGSRANVRSGRRRIGAAATAASTAPLAMSSNTSSSTATKPKPKARGAGSRARNQAASKITGRKMTRAGEYKTFAKDSSAAKNFRSAFATARKAGKKTFTWNGKRYTTETK